MSDPMITELVRPGNGVAVLGHGFAEAPTLADVPVRRIPSVYADPVAWLILAGVEQSIADCSEDIAAVADSVGHIVVSDVCTCHTMRDLANTIADGHLSPLRFSGANPGAICGLSCHVLRLRGPSATLSMRPADGLPAAVAIGRMWLRQRAAEFVVLSAHRLSEQGRHMVSSTIIGRDRSELV